MITSSEFLCQLKTRGRFRIFRKGWLGQQNSERGSQDTCRPYIDTIYSTENCLKIIIQNFTEKRGVCSPLDHPLFLPMKICNIYKPSYKLHIVPAICFTQRRQAHPKCEQVKYYKMPNYTSSKLNGLRISKPKFHLRTLDSLF